MSKTYNNPKNINLSHHYGDRCLQYINHIVGTVSCILCIKRFEHYGRFWLYYTLRRNGSI